MNAKVLGRRAWGVCGRSAHLPGSLVVLVLPAQAPHGLGDTKDPVSFSQKAVFPTQTKLAGDSGIVGRPAEKPLEGEVRCLYSEANP